MTTHHWPMQPPCLALLAQWQQQGLLRSLDVALAQVLLRCTDTPARPSSPSTDADAVILAALLSRYLADGHTCLRLNELATDLKYLRPVDDQTDTPEPLPHQWWAQHDVAAWGQRLQESRLVTTQPAQMAAPLVLEGGLLYLYRLWAAESGIAKILEYRLPTTFALDDETIADLQAMFPSDGSAEEQEPDWQMLACAMALGGAVTLITGGPGTGKTTTVMRLLALLQQQALRACTRASAQPLKMALAAPTGKAAARLTESIAEQMQRLNLDAGTEQHIPTQVTTLHRLLGSRPDTRRFAHNHANPLVLDVLVVDEASMIDLELMHALLRALPDHARLILLGDKDQLASVEAGAILGELCHSAEQGWYAPSTWSQFERVHGRALLAANDVGLRLAQPGQHPLAQRTVMLRHSRRFSATSGIGQLAAAINAMDTVAASQLLAKPTADVVHVSAADPGADVLRELVREGYANFSQILDQPPAWQEHRKGAATLSVGNDVRWHRWARQLLKAFDEFRLLCAVREGPWGTKAMNTLVEQWLGVCAGEVAVDDQSWYAGRPVMLTKNDYSLGLMNGDIGIVVALPDDTGKNRLRVVFPHSDDSELVRFVLPGRLPAVETVYAMTVHKSQGSEFDHTVLVLPDTSAPILTKELLYTGVTRARRQLSLVSPDSQVLERAISRRVRRYSGLRDRLLTGL